MACWYEGEHAAKARRQKTNAAKARSINIVFSSVNLIRISSTPKTLLMAIPVVDLSDFLSGDSKKKQKFVNELGRAYEDVGFVAVKNHGIPDSVIGDLYKHVQQFFALPSSSKKQYEVPGLGGQRGYT